MESDRKQCLHQKFIGREDMPRRCLLPLMHSGLCDFEPQMRVPVDYNPDNTSTPPSLAKLKRTQPGDATAMLATFTDVEVREECARRHPDHAAIIARELPDDQLRAECARRWSTEFQVTVPRLKAERDEWMRRAEAAERAVVPVVVTYSTRTAPGCGVCGAPFGRCTPSCNDDRVPDAAVKPFRESIEAEHTPDSGRGLAQLHFERPRPDNSVAHLDEDLLCEDAP